MNVDIIYKEGNETLEIHAKGFFPLSQLKFSNVKRELKKELKLFSESGQLRKHIIYTNPYEEVKNGGLIDIQENR